MEWKSTSLSARVMDRNFEDNVINELILGKESIFENGRQVCTLFMKGTTVDEK